MLVRKREGGEVKNEFVTEQSQVLGGRFTIVRKGCHQSHDTHSS